jgi:hypothetical protein
LTIRKPFEIEVQIDGAGEVTLLFTPLRGGEPERDAAGSLVRFAVPLRQDDPDLALLIRHFARWLTDLVLKEMQALQADVHKATDSAHAAPAEPRRGQKSE